MGTSAPGAAQFGSGAHPHRAGLVSFAHGVPGKVLSAMGNGVSRHAGAIDENRRER
jgi:hypothetical protein